MAGRRSQGGEHASGAIKSAKRVLEIFEFFAHRREAASVGEIANALGYPQSSTSLLMKCLHDLRYMHYDMKQRLYRPTLRLALTASRLRDQHVSGPQLTAMMTDLRDETGGSVVLGIQNDIDLQYVQSIPALMPVQFVMRIGQRRPLCRTAVGKALLARQPDETIAALVRRINARGDADHIAIKDLLTAIAKVRSDGVAYSVNAASPGAAVIAAVIPVPEPDLPMAIGIGGPVDYIEQNRKAITEMLRRTLFPGIEYG